MGVSNYRIKQANTVHHLISRIAHRVYFLLEKQRGEFLEVTRRAAEFCGVKLIGWCVMTNHFHLLVFLPERVEIDEAETVHRYSVLKGAAAGSALEMSLARMRARGEDGACEAEERLSAIRRRMYDIGEFMKIVKQWFTEKYNLDHSHKGTLWESPYHDVPIPNENPSLSRTLAYIDINPVSGGITPDFDGYIWSSFTAFVRGDPTAAAGLRFVYGEDFTDEELREAHEEAMYRALDEKKRERAASLARRRAAGIDLPADPLTTEAMIRQAEQRQKELEDEVVRLSTERMSEKSRARKMELLRRIVEIEHKLHPELKTRELAKKSGCSYSTVSRILSHFVKQKV